MCDYSLHTVTSRSAKVGDKLVGNHNPAALQLPPAHSIPLGIQFPRRGLECLGKQSGGNRQKRQSDNAEKQSVKVARRHECRCRRQKALKVGYRGAFSRRGFG